MTVRIGARWIRPALRAEEEDGRLRLVAVGLPVGNVLLRLFCTAAVLFPGASTVLAVYAMDGRPGGALVAGAFVQLLFAPFWLFFAWLGGMVTEHWTMLEFDGAAGRIRGRAGGRFLWFSRSVEIALDDVRALEVAFRRSDDGGAYRLDVEARRRSPGAGASDEDGEDWSVGGRLEAVDRPAGAVALVRRLGDALGWKGVEVLRRDHMELRVRLGPGPEADLRRKVETGGEAADEGARAPGQGELPEIEPGPFRPDDFHSTHRIVAWRPGERVEVRRDRWSPKTQRRAYVVVPLALNLPVLMIAGVVLLGRPEWRPLWPMIVGVPVAAMAGVGVVLARALGSRVHRAVFDWRAGRARFRWREGRASVSLEALEALVVRGERTERSSSDSGPKRTYRCRVYALTPDRKFLVAETGSHPAAEAAYRPAASLADDLADALGVPWTWRGFREVSSLEALMELFESE